MTNRGLADSSTTWLVKIWRSNFDELVVQAIFERRIAKTDTVTDRRGSELIGLALQLARRKFDCWRPYAHR